MSCKLHPYYCYYYYYYYYFTSPGNRYDEPQRQGVDALPEYFS